MRISANHPLRRWGPAAAGVLAGVAAQLHPEVLTPVVAAGLQAAGPTTIDPCRGET